MAVKNKSPSVANLLISQSDRPSGNKSVASSNSQEATQTQAGMQHAQKLIHAIMCVHVRTVSEGKLRPYCFTNKHVQLNSGKVYTFTHVFQNSHPGHAVKQRAY